MDSENRIIASLHDRFAGSWICSAPRITPRTWWECDLLALTKSCLTIEYEVKRTIEDFYADKCKARSGRTKTTTIPKGWEHVYEKKKDALQNATKGCPNRFYYVVPDELSEKVKLNTPKNIGVIGFEFEWLTRVEEYTKFANIYQRRKAGLLHRTPADDKIQQQISTALAWRFWGQFFQIEQERADRRRERGCVNP